MTGNGLWTSADSTAGLAVSTAVAEADTAIPGTASGRPGTEALWTLGSLWHGPAELAEAVSDAYCPTGPVVPQRVAAEKGITLSFGHYGEAFDGMLECRNGRFHIFCNLVRLATPTSPRARFTMGHELGHYYIDEHRHALASGRIPPHLSHCEFESPLLAEQEADHFAANLLMPENRFRRTAMGAGRGFGAVLSLVGHFGNSLTSTAIRYASVDVFPCAVIKWHWRGYRWKCFSSSMFRRRFQRVFELPEKLPEDSATRMALAQKATPECGYFQSGTLASAWFPWVRREDTLDVILIEEAVPLGRYGALTMLYPQWDCPIFSVAAARRRKDGLSRRGGANGGCC